MNEMKENAAPLRKVLFRAAMIMLSVLIVGGAVWVTCLHYYANHKPKIHIEYTGGHLLQNDGVIGYVPVMNGACYRKDYLKDNRFHVYTDNIGARRNQPGGVRKGRVDVMGIGGSFTWGHGLENQDTFLQLVSQATGVAVANLSFGSYGTVQAFQMYERYAGLKPKIVVYGFIDDHLRRNITPCAPGHAPTCFAVSYIDIDRHGNPFIHPPLNENNGEKIMGFYKDIQRGGYGFDQVYWGAAMMAKKIRDRRQADRVKTIPDLKTRAFAYVMEKLVSKIRENKAKLVVIYIPYVQGNRIDPPPAVLTQNLPRDVVFIDMSPVFKRHFANPKALPLHQPKDGHPNALANRLIARELIPVVQGILGERAFDN